MLHAPVKSSLPLGAVADLLASSASLQHELARLERLGLIAHRADGRLVRYCTQRESPRWKALREVVREITEPAETLRVALAPVAGITAAFIFGSFARRIDIHPASDVDLFVVANGFNEPAGRLLLAEVILEVSGVLGREVNVTRYTPTQLATKLAMRARFVTSVLAGEKEWLIGDEVRLSEAIAAVGLAPGATIPSTQGCRSRIAPACRRLSQCSQ